ncbi:MAG: HEAT repeat domain-containing protein [bacterium]
MEAKEKTEPVPEQSQKAVELAYEIAKRPNGLSEGREITLSADDRTAMGVDMPLPVLVKLSQYKLPQRPREGYEGTDDAWLVRAVAVHCLIRLHTQGGPEVEQAVLRCARDRSWIVRRQVARGFVKPEYFSVVSQPLDLLRKLLNDDEPPVVEEALRCLYRNGTEAAADVLLSYGLNALPIEEQRLAALSLLQKLGSPHLLPQVAAVFPYLDGEEIITLVLIMLLSEDTAPALQLFAALLEMSNKKPDVGQLVRVLEASKVGGLPLVAACRACLPCIVRTDNDIRDCIHRLLGKASGSAAIKLLADEFRTDPLARSEAFRVLIELEESGSDDARAAVDGLLADPEASLDLRLASARLILRGRRHSDRRIEPLIRQLLRNPDERLRDLGYSWLPEQIADETFWSWLEGLLIEIILGRHDEGGVESPRPKTDGSVVKDALRFVLGVRCSRRNRILRDVLVRLIAGQESAGDDEVKNPNMILAALNEASEGDPEVLLRELFMRELFQSDSDQVDSDSPSDET